jgi:ribonucleoside-diphosphate reductase, beta subunit
MKKSYDLVLAQLISNDSIQSSQLVERINCFVTSPIVNACLIQQAAEECCISGTEVLTEDGKWIKVDKLKVGDRILSANENLEFYYANVTAMTIKHVDEYLYKIESDKISQVVTKGHRIPFVYNGKLRVKKVKDVYSFHSIVGKALSLYSIPNIGNQLPDSKLIDVTYGLVNDFAITKEKMDTLVYCPTVSGGLFVCKYDGKVSLTGNCVHSDSYSVMAEDICQDTDRIYSMWKYDEELAIKNKAVADMYQMLYNSDDPTEEDLLLAFVANNCLENIVFLGGFAFFFSIEDILVGSGELIAEIAKDEILSHVPLFANIFRTAIAESFNGVVPEEVVKKAHAMITMISEAEKRWTNYVANGTILGFSDRTIKVFIEHQANEVCKNMGIPPVYEDHSNEDNPLLKLVKDHVKGGEVATKTLFFEGNVADYSKAAVKMDLDLDDLNLDD